MMAPSFSMVLMLLAMVGQTGNHLLDFASTEAYWKSKNVAVSVETMLAELKPPPAAADMNRQIVELASPDPAAREAASGVNLDEEMANMVAYQHAYNAAARFLTAIDEALDTLVNGTGRVGR